MDTVSIIIAIVLLAIAWKVLMGLLRMAAIVAIAVGGYLLWSSGAIAGGLS